MILTTTTARVAVHFLAVTDRFAPHDVVVSISSPEELSDVALTSACTLHTAAPSSSSSSGSSRQQKLSWIQETAEEGAQPGGDDNANALRSTPSKPAIPTILEPTSSNEDEPLRNGSVTSQAESVPLMLDPKVVEAKAPETAPAPEESTSPESDLTELQATLRSYDKLFEGGPEPRLSSQTARPDYNELYEHYYAQYTKPKVKLGPRPRPSLEGRRPSTSGSAPNDLARPVSSLPSGLRSSTRKATEKKESKTRTSSTIPTIAIPPPPPIPMSPDMPHSPASPGYSIRTPASVRSMPVSAYSSHHRSTGMTQEKTRLMKALELRKKQQKMLEERREKLSGDLATPPVSEEKAPDAQPVDDAPSQGTPLQKATTSESQNTSTTTHDEENTKSDSNTSFGDDHLSTPGLESSGLVFAGSHAETDDLNSAASVSSPISAQTQGSSGAPSTRPSSISEDDSGALDRSRKVEEDSDSQSPDQDEEQSVDSTPTIVPESTTPIPSVEVHIQPSQAPATSDQSSVFDPDTTGLTIPSGDEDARSWRRTKRESTIYMPAGDVFQPDEAQKKKRIRESVLMPSTNRQSWYETKERRRVMPDPLQVSADNSETEYLSDDSFMEELQTATVHQAQPMSVSKSPITPFFPRKSSAPESAPPTAHSYRSFSRGSPDRLVRKASGGWPPRPDPSDTVVVTKKINVSSGISQRIKALAEKSSRELQSPPGTANSNLDAPGSTLAQRKSSFFAATPLEMSPNGRPVTRLGSPSFLTSSASSTPDKKKQPGPVKSTVYNVQRGLEKPESVQVTARIIRDERSAKPTLAMPTGSTPLELHQSPLIIDHQKPTWTPKSPTRGRTDPTSPRAPTSSSHSREQSIAPSRTSSESTWRAFGRRMSESKSVHSYDGDDKRTDKTEKKDKKESRTSKMFKRMSTTMSSTMPWKASSSNLGLREQDSQSTSLFSLREPPPAVHVGDLNIQFPDTLVRLVHDHIIWYLLTS